jgi:hypothetical protein
MRRERNACCTFFCSKDRNSLTQITQYVNYKKMRGLILFLLVPFFSCSTAELLCTFEQVNLRLDPSTDNPAVGQSHVGQAFKIERREFHSPLNWAFVRVCGSNRKVWIADSWFRPCPVSSICPLPAPGTVPDRHDGRTSRVLPIGGDGKCGANHWLAEYFRGPSWEGVPLHKECIEGPNPVLREWKIDGGAPFLMYDAVNSQGPPAHNPDGSTVRAVAGYIDGAFQSFEALRQRYPNAFHVSITVLGTPGARVCDIEAGDLTPSGGAAWAKKEIAARRRPTLYCSQSMWRSVVAALNAISIHATQVDFWIANYDGIAKLPAGAVAKQFKNTAQYDVSITNGVWPGEIKQEFPANVPPADFSIRMTTEVTLNHGGPHVFFVETDGSAVLHVDGKQVVDDGGRHRRRRVERRADLAIGKHKFQVDYVHHTGSRTLECGWQAVLAPPTSHKPEDVHPSANGNLYTLPWPVGQSFFVTQGANGISHKGMMLWAIDFGMPVSTHLLAAHDGTVTFVKNNGGGCGGPEAVGLANYIVIQHPSDGHSTAYWHLSRVDVTQGQKVRQGQLLGLSGETGWTYCGPHLHYQRQVNCGSYWCQSVPTHFSFVAPADEPQPLDYDGLNHKIGHASQSARTAGIQRSAVNLPSSSDFPLWAIIVIAAVGAGILVAAAIIVGRIWYVKHKQQDAPQGGNEGASPPTKPLGRPSARAEYSALEGSGSMTQLRRK